MTVPLASTRKEMGCPPKRGYYSVMRPSRRGGTIRQFKKVGVRNLLGGLAMLLAAVAVLTTTMLLRFAAHRTNRLITTGSDISFHQPNVQRRGSLPSIPGDAAHPLRKEGGKAGDDGRKGEGSRRRTRHDVHFIPPEQLARKDPFSASWWQSTERFHRMNPENINMVEVACFQALRPREEIRMTADWLDFAVEHMSKWWKLAGALSNGDDPVPFERIMSAFQKYIDDVSERNRSVFKSKEDRLRRQIDLPPKRMLQKDPLDANPDRTTIALVAFAPYKSGRENPKKFGYVSQLESDPPPDEWGDRLTAISLAATMASLLEAGFVGRVVVVGYRDGDRELVEKATSILQRSLGTVELTDDGSAAVGHMGVVYVRSTLEDVTSRIKVNMPKAAITGLQRALRGDLNQTETELWLGPARDNGIHSWNYVYLTEPDTILHTRQESIPTLRKELDSGMIASPHRLQPIPHEADLPQLQDVALALSNVGNFSVVRDVDTSKGGACCDRGLQHPGAYPATLPKCGNFWWLCGFGKRDGGDPETDHHWRLAKYEFMRLKNGMGIVSLAGSEHGRMCRPTVNEECKPVAVARSE